MDTAANTPTDVETEGFGSSVRKAVETYSASIDSILTKARLATQMLDAKQVTVQGMN